ncbi:MAG: hypothetical protein NVSMB42_13460 [Herpetosiphon sp.]
MNTTLQRPRFSLRTPLATLGRILVASLILNALAYVVVAVATSPRPIIMAHIAGPLVLAAIIAFGHRWTPALGALLNGLMLADAVIFVGDKLTHPDGAITFFIAALIFATNAVGLVAGLAATLQNYRRPLAERKAPQWTGSALFSLAVLIIGATLATTIQPHGRQSSVSPEVLATLPALQMKNFQFEQQELKARVGETVAIRLVNGDNTIHYFDIDELNVHTLGQVGESTLVLIKPQQAGNYTFYCHTHADKAAGSGMLGHLVVAP